MDFTLLIADDEEYIRKGFIARLKYVGFEPKVVYEAQNGREALEIIRNCRPTIIVTDIKMPDMDGLELIRIVKKEFSKWQFIILSGYAEFSYAEQAINMGVQAYLLKPLSNDALREVMEKTLQNIEEERENAGLLTTFQMAETAKEKLFQEKLIISLLFDKTDGEELTEKRKQDCALLFGSKQIKQFFSVAVIHIDGHTYTQVPFAYQDLELIQFSIQNIFDEMMVPMEIDYKILDNLENQNQLLVILAGPNKETIKKCWEFILPRFRNALWKKLSISLTIGVSETEDYLSSRLYQQVQEAFLQRVIHGPGNIYFYADLPYFSQVNFPDRALLLFERYIERGDINNIESILYEIFNMEQMKDAKVAFLRVILVRIVNILIKNIDSSKMEIDYESLFYLEQLAEFESIDELVKYIFCFILENLQKTDHIEMSSKNKMKLAQAYIERNYNKDISVNDLAEQYSMSANYFSTIFKNETGLSVVNYVKKIRIQEACHLLKKTNCSVVDISRQIGYEDSQYFFRIFKKELGVTPMQYRKEQRGKSE